jgi:hypothetical protein
MSGRRFSRAGRWCEVCGQGPGATASHMCRASAYGAVLRSESETGLRERSPVSRLPWRISAMPSAPP